MAIWRKNFFFVDGGLIFSLADGEIEDGGMVLAGFYHDHTSLTCFVAAT